jgi:hypothetical protein
VDKERHYFGAGNAAAPPLEQTATRDTVQSALARQAIEIDALIKLSMVLADRLNPVLANVPHATDKEAANEPEPSGIRGRIDQHSRQLARVAASLVRLLDRVEL